MKKILGILIITIISFSSVWGQINTLYFNKNINQSTLLNPARQNTCKFAFGLPVISSTYVDIKHTGFRYSDLYFEDPTKPYNSRFVLDIENFYNNLDDDNYLFFNNHLNLLNFAFKIRDFQVTFDANLNVEQNFVYPKSIFSIKDGLYFEDKSKYFTISGLAEDLNTYISYSVGLSKEVLPGLTIGGKAKLLKGISNITTNDFQMDLHIATEEDAIYDYTIDTKFDINTSTPAKIYPTYDANGRINGMDIDTNRYKEKLLENPQDIFLTKNTGFAFDLGFIYQLNKKVEISASILDLGFIKWKNHPLQTTTEQSSFTYSGFDLGKYVKDLGIVNSLNNKEKRDSILKEVQEDMLDTLIALSNPTFDSVSYKTNLNARINAGVAFMPTNWATIGFLYSGYKYREKLFSSYTFSGSVMFWRGWSYTVSYTMFKKSMNNLGMGLSLKIGPVQTYLQMSNIAVPLLGARYLVYPNKPYNEGVATNWVKNSQKLNLHFGINFIFGCKESIDYGIID